MNDIIPFPRPEPHKLQAPVRRVPNHLTARVIAIAALGTIVFIVVMAVLGY